MGVSGCDGATIYRTDFDRGPHNGSLRIMVEPDVAWTVAVWES